jgi:hypothetical protein
MVLRVRGMVRGRVSSSSGRPGLRRGSRTGLTTRRACPECARPGRGWPLPGRFFPDWGRHVFPDWGRHVTAAELADAAVAEATASGARCKIIADWAWDAPPARHRGRGGGAADQRGPAARGGRRRGVLDGPVLARPARRDGRRPGRQVAYDEDPAAHPDVLHRPSRVILRGQVLT